MSPTAKHLLSAIVVGIVTGVVSSAVVAYGAYRILQQNISAMVADGLTILNVQETSSALGEISANCRDATRILATPTTRPARELMDELQTTLNQLKRAIIQVKVTENYSPEEMRDAIVGFSQADAKALMQQFVGKPRRVVVGLPQVKPIIAVLEQQSEALRRELVREPHIDIEKLRSTLASAETIATATQAALDSRQTATLLTLEKFGKQR